MITAALIASVATNVLWAGSCYRVAREATQASAKRVCGALALLGAVGSGGCLIAAVCLNTGWMR